jgi:prophage antirepressor-like protein
MLNIFKSPKKQSVVQTVHKDETSLLVKQFNGLNIQVYGTYDEPLFKAKDIGELLGIKDIKSTIRDFDNDEKGVHNMHTPGGLQEVSMLKEQGLYKLLMISRRPETKQFQKWVFEVIKEIRLKGKYDLQERGVYAPTRRSSSCRLFS